MKIDLRKEGRLTVDQSRKINEIEPQVRYEFDQYIGKLASENSLNGIDWFWRLHVETPLHLICIIGFVKLP